MSGRFDTRIGLKCAVLSLLKLVVLFTAIMSMCLYVLTVFSDSAGMIADTGGLLMAGVMYAVPFFLIPVITFIAEGFAPGDRLRLIGRISICAYTLIILFVISGGMSYAINDILLDSTTGTTAKTVSLTVLPEPLMMILALIPVLSAIDAVLEHLEPSTTKGWDLEK